MSLIHLVGFVLSFCFTFTVVLAEHNVTVDDTSSLITYKGSWSSVDSPLDYNGSHSYSQDPTATATLQFTGIAIYFMAPLWPYPVNTELTVDSFSPELVSMVDPSHTTASGTAETVSYSVLWGMTALENTTHTLVASMAVGGQFVVMDGLIYTVLDPGDTPPPVSSPVPSSTSSGSSSSSPSGSGQSNPHSSGTSTGPIIAGVVGGVVLVVAFVIGTCFWCRRRQRQVLLAEEIDNGPELKPITPFLSGNGAQPQPPLSMSSHPYGNALPEQQRPPSTVYSSTVYSGASYGEGYQPLPQRIDTPMHPQSDMYQPSTYEALASIGNAMMVPPPSSTASYPSAPGGLAPQAMYPSGTAALAHQQPQQLQQQYHSSIPMTSQGQFSTAVSEGSQFPAPSSYASGYPPPQQPQQYQQYPQSRPADNPAVTSPASTSGASEYSSTTVVPSSVSTQKRHVSEQKQAGGPAPGARVVNADEENPPPAYTQM